MTQTFFSTCITALGEKLFGEARKARQKINDRLFLTNAISLKNFMYKKTSALEQHPSSGAEREECTLYEGPLTDIQSVPGGVAVSRPLGYRDAPLQCVVGRGRDDHPEQSTVYVKYL
jgi:hypothetical protein